MAVSAPIKFTINQRILTPLALLTGLALTVANCVWPWAMPNNAHFQPALLCPLLVVNVALHEATHAAVGYILGAKPHLGFKKTVAYCTFVDPIPRKHYLMIAIAPLLLLGILFIAIAQVEIVRIYALVFVIMNTAGSFGDLWVVFKLLPFSNSAFVVDRCDGFEVLMDISENSSAS